MKNVKPNKAVTGLALLLLNGKENNSGQSSREKTVVTDECGDTLWDDVLEQEEKNLLAKSNEENEKPVDDQGKIKEQH